MNDESFELPPFDGKAAVDAFCGQAEDIADAIMQHHASIPPEGMMETEMLLAAEKLSSLARQMRTLMLGG